MERGVSESGAPGGDYKENDCSSMLPELPASQPMAPPFQLAELQEMSIDPSAFSFDTSLPTELSIESNMAILDSPDLSLGLPLMDCGPTVYSLSTTALDMVRAHVADSRAKLSVMRQSDLSGKFMALSSNDVAQRGLITLATLLSNDGAPSALDVICFVHVAYSLSLVLHQEDASRRCAQHFAQAMRYGSLFSYAEMVEYCHIAECLWKPQAVAMSDAELPACTTFSDNSKGKQPQRHALPGEPDSLTFVSQCFLDGTFARCSALKLMLNSPAELEYAAIGGEGNQDIYVSAVTDLHSKDAHVQAQANTPYYIAVTHMINALCRRYAQFSAFLPCMHNLMLRFGSNSIPTPRRLELELMHAGKVGEPEQVSFLPPLMAFLADVAAIH